METQPEDDDALHFPDPRRDYRKDMGGSICTKRGLTNLGCVVLLGVALLGLLLVFSRPRNIRC